MNVKSRLTGWTEIAACELSVVVNVDDLWIGWITSFKESEHNISECNESWFNISANQMHFSISIMN